MYFMKRKYSIISLNTGFTLTEVVISIGITSIVLATLIALVSYQNKSNKNNFQLATFSQLVGAVQLLINNPKACTSALNQLYYNPPNVALPDPTYPLSLNSNPYPTNPYLIAQLNLNSPTSLPSSALVVNSSRYLDIYIDAINFTNLVSYNGKGISPPAAVTVLNSSGGIGFSSYMANIMIVAQKDDPASTPVTTPTPVTTRYGLKYLMHNFPLNIITDTSNKITACGNVFPASLNPIMCHEIGGNIFTPGPIPQCN
jgi:type II secretory pathway pseudopilin PulG